MDCLKEICIFTGALNLNVMIRKIVISPSNAKTVAILEELNRKKAAIKRRLEARSLGKVKGDADTRTGK
jgi:hypothetical protein